MYQVLTGFRNFGAVGTNYAWRFNYKQRYVRCVKLLTADDLLQFRRVIRIDGGIPACYIYSCVRSRFLNSPDATNVNLHWVP